MKYLSDKPMSQSQPQGYSLISRAVTSEPAPWLVAPSTHVSLQCIYHGQPGLYPAHAALLLGAKQQPLSAFSACPFLWGFKMALYPELSLPLSRGPKLWHPWDEHFQQPPGHREQRAERHLKGMQHERGLLCSFFASFLFQAIQLTWPL